MFRSLLLATIGALMILAPSAAAHISVVPAEAETGSETPFLIRIPNETGLAMTTARVAFPSGVRVVGPITPPAGWTVNPLAGSGSDLSGADFDGSLPSGETLEVTVVATPITPGPAVWRIEQTLSDGSMVLWTGNPDPTSTEEPGEGEVGPAVQTNIVGATLEPESPPDAEPDATPPPPDETAPADPDTPSAEEPAADDGDSGSVSAWIVVLAGIVALLGLGAAGWMWSNRPMELPPDEK